MFKKLDKILDEKKQSIPYDVRFSETSNEYKIMKDFIEYLVKNIVDEPDQVQINLVESENHTIVEINVAKEDIGKIIGKKGKIIQSLRTLAMTIGARLGQRFQLEIIQ